MYELLVCDSFTHFECAVFNFCWRLKSVTGQQSSLPTYLCFHCS